MDVEAYDEVQIVVRFTGGQATEPSTTEPCLNHCAPENLSRWCKQPIRIGLYQTPRVLLQASFQGGTPESLPQARSHCGSSLGVFQIALNLPTHSLGISQAQPNSSTIVRLGFSE